MLFYVYDIDDYRDNFRGFYFDFAFEASVSLVKTKGKLLTRKIERFGFKPSEITESFYGSFVIWKMAMLVSEL